MYLGFHRLLHFLMLISISFASTGVSLSVQNGELAGSEWSIPKLIFEDQDGFMRRDTMLADTAGTLHLYWSHNPHSPYDDNVIYDEKETAIFYQSLFGGTWSDAHDVLVDSQAKMPFGADIDPQGTLHIVTLLGFNCLAYLQVPVWLAGDPHAWSQSGCIKNAGDGTTDLTIDHNGVLYVIYPPPNQESLALIKSSDGGASWSFSVEIASVFHEEGSVQIFRWIARVSPIATSSAPDRYVGFPRLVVDAEGRLHATWGELQAPGGYPWRRLMYSRSLDGGSSWSVPAVLAEERQGEINIAVFQDTVHVVWNGDAAYKGRYYRHSDDGGLTWSPPEELPLPQKSGGLQGPPAIVVDSTGTVHILYTDSPHLYYITRRGNEWSESVEIAGLDNTGATREINYPMLRITGGNQLHALYTRDAQAVYYQQRTIDAPYQASVSYDHFIAQHEASLPDPDPGIAANPVDEADPPNPIKVNSPQPIVRSPLYIIAIGTLPVSLIVMGLVIYSRHSKRRLN